MKIESVSFFVVVFIYLGPWVGSVGEKKKLFSILDYYDQRFAQVGLYLNLIKDETNQPSY